MTLEARQHGFHMALKSSRHHNDANARRDSKSSNFWVDQHHRFEKQSTTGIVTFCGAIFNDNRKTKTQEIITSTMAAAQPDQNTAYNAAGNAATKEPAEQQTAQQKQKDDAPRTFV